MIKVFLRIRELIYNLKHLDRNVDEIKINQGRILTGMQSALRSAPLWQYEFKVFSQWGEDGIIQYLVNNIAIRNRTFIEFGVEDFSESNCRFLMMKDKWSGYVIDGSPSNILKLRSSYFYWQNSINCKASFITRENVGDLLDESGFDKFLGILSVDIDGVDYHVLEALDDWCPSILIVEFNEVFGWSRPVTVPYDANYVRGKKHSSNQYYGANLPAFLYLANQRGYALVGTNSVSSNAFFVRRELLNERVQEVDISSCIRQANFRESRGERNQLTYLSGHERLHSMLNMPLIDVSSGAEICVRDLI